MTSAVLLFIVKCLSHLGPTYDEFWLAVISWVMKGGVPVFRKPKWWMRFAWLLGKLCLKTNLFSDIPKDQVQGRSLLLPQMPYLSQLWLDYKQYFKKKKVFLVLDHSLFCVKVKSLSRVRLFVIPWTVTYQAVLHSWDFPGKNTGVGCHFLLQEIFLTQGLNPGLPHCRQTLYHLSHQGSH